MRSLLPGVLLAALLAFPVAADDRDIPPNDEIVLQLRSEAWVETSTARLVAVVERVLTGEQAADQNRRVPAVLNELAPDTDWRVVGFNRSRDASGLERWRIVAEARLPESALGGIYDRAQAASKPGQQVSIAEVDFSPTLAEREATMAKLRADIYRRAAEEAARAAEVWPDRGFRVQRVEFAFGGGPTPPQPLARFGKAAAAPEAAASMAMDAGAGLDLSERMVVTATVVLAAPPPAQPDTASDSR